MVVLFGSGARVDGRARWRRDLISYGVSWYRRYAGSGWAWMRRPWYMYCCHVGIDGNGT